MDFPLLVAINSDKIYQINKVMKYPFNLKMERY